MPVGPPLRWVIGPLSLWLRRRAHEVVVHWKLGPDPLASDLEEGVASDPPPDDATAERFALDPSVPLELRPGLADRRVVVRPETPLHVVHSAVLYVSTPLWVAVAEVGGAPLLTLPSWRPADTWFGPNTRVGELAYGSTTRGRFSAAELADAPARAVSRVRITNRAAAPLRVERIAVPVASLDLFRDSTGRLWTNEIRVVQDEGGALVAADVVPGPPPEAPGAQLLAAAPAPPRERSIAATLGRLLL